MALLPFPPRPAPASASNSAADDLASWRNQILQVSLVATAVLAGFGYVPGVIAAARAELWIVVIADTLVWGLVIALAVARDLPYGVRAIAFATSWYLLALLLLVMVGPDGGGMIWLLSFPVAVSVFMGLRAILVALLLDVVTVIAFGLLIWRRPGVFGAGPSGLGYDLTAWMASSGSLVLLSAVLSLSVAYLVRGMERSLAEVHASRTQLSEAKQRIEAEMAEQERLREELVQSQKMEALGTLAGGIAHDFNNILVPILLQSQELRDRTSKSSPEWEELDGIVRSASRARGLVRGILGFSRKSSEKAHPIDLEAMIREVGTLLRSSMPAGIEIRYGLSADGARIMGSAGEIHQALLNLGTNAYLAMREEGGILTLGTFRDRDTNEVVVRVDDEGVGIPLEIQARVFDPFYTTRGPGEGTGLGLAIVRRIVTGLGGTLHLTSEPGAGTRVELRFPETADDPSVEEFPARAEPESASDPEAKRPSILLVDDESAVRRVAGRVLVRLGYRVLESASPAEALREIRRAPDGIDLLLTDQSMPGMTGLELARRVREIRSGLPILLVSGYLDHEALRTVDDLGIEGVLHKPYDRESLHHAVERALGSE